MALTSTIYSTTLEISDVDRGVYQTADLRLARHPSETPEYLATRIIAYALEWAEGIEFSSGLSNGEEAAIVIRDLTGTITSWIDVGMPDADRIHRASKFAGRVAIYTHRDIRNVMAQFEGRKIHRGAEIPVYSFDRGFIEDVASRLERRVAVSLSLVERHLYLTVDSHSFESDIHEQRLG